MAIEQREPILLSTTKNQLFWV